MTHGHGYWRSLEQLAGGSSAVEGEFSEGASELPEGISRRDMLTLLGASISLAGLAGCRKPAEEIVPFVEAPENVIPGVPKRYATTMPLGLDSYGLVVESHEGRPTKIEGNEQHPATLGSSSAWIQASILGLYDPDRSQTVRAGGEKKSWGELVAAWKEIEAEHAGAGGAGLAVLSESFASPTLARLARRFEERFPQALWATYEPLGDDAIFAGVEAATGQRLRPMLHLDRAAVVLALDADFLGVDGDVVRNTRGFATARAADRGSMNRLWVVEAHYSLTGANADHRLRLPASRVPELVSALSAELARRGVAPSHPEQAAAHGVPGVDPTWLAALADDLIEHRGSGLVVAGRRQAPAVHAAVLALNVALGNVGSTVTYREPLDARLPGDLGPLVQAMQDGRVSTLVVLGANPLHNAPVDLEFAAAFARVARKIHLGPYVDETAAAADWHVPQAHYLESWGDARAVDGTLSVIQPLIAPLYDGKSAVDVLGLIATGEERSAHEHVRETWQGILGAIGFEPRWRQALHDGLLAGSAVEPVQPRLVAGAEYTPAGATVAAPGPDDLELEFLASPAVFDGRFANNGWLQEAPDSLTKLSWDNAALVGPHTAGELGVASGDVVRIVSGERAITAPVWVLPGQAEFCVGLYLGHGRRFGGRIAGAAGFDAYPLRTAAAPGHQRGARIERTGETHRLTTTQEHGTMTEPNLAPWQKGQPERKRDLVREATFEHYQRDPEFARGHLPQPQRALWSEPTYDQGHQWGMTIDLNSCVGCNACVVACQSENNVPIVGQAQVHKGREMHWLRLDRYFDGATEDPRVVFQAVPCMHCENAPCEQVCPVAATVHDDQGLNLMVYNRCIGTRYCSNNCPYKVRRFNFFNFTKDTPESLSMANNPDVTVRSRGVMEKCTYCVQRIHEGEIAAKLEGRALADGDIRTACQQACPAEAIRFGDINDPASRVRETKGNPRNYVLLEELFTKPRTTFLAKLRNPHPRLAGPSETPDDHGAAEGHHG